MSANDSKHLSLFADPVPYRSIGAVVHRHFVKKKMLEMLQKEIVTQVSTLLPELRLTGKKLNPI
jgi:LysR family transcriptional regulator, hydrogen peroxide-inducible genes activator